MHLKNDRDNSVLETIFGLVKLWIYHITRQYIVYVSFPEMTETDFNCYNIKQIKIKLKGMSPVEYRLIPKKSL